MSYPIFYSDDPVRDAERYYAWLDRQMKCADEQDEYEHDDDECEEDEDE